jgi:TRAP-type C4-dicarboxylate transport system substrate-binding protein
MNFLALNDDVKFIIANHLKSDNKIKKKFMTKEDDKLQKILLDEVKEMTLNIEDVINISNKNEIDFFKKNYNKIYTLDNEDHKDFYESYEELKIDADFLFDML